MRVMPPSPTRLLALYGKRPVQLALVTGLVVYIIQRISRFNPSNIWPLKPRLDAEVIFTQSVRVWNDGYYSFEQFHTIALPFLFPYPPSAIFFFRSLAEMGPAVFALVWLVSAALGLIVMLRMSLAGDKLDFPYVWIGIGLVALLIADSPIMWDLHHENSNLLYIALVLAAFGLMSRYAVTAGILLGLSVSLKIFSGLIFVWLLFFGPRRTLVSGTVTLLMLWVALPLLVFGVDGSISLYHGWLDQLRVAANKFEFIPNAGPQNAVWIFDVQTTAMVLTGSGPFDDVTQYVAWALRSIWVALLLFYVSAMVRAPAPVAPSRAVLADWTMLMLAPLPLSPWLELYHPVADLTGAVLLIATALDDDAPSRDRLVALIASTTLLLDLVLNPFPATLRGLGLLMRMAVIVISLSLLRRSMPNKPWPKPSPAPQPFFATA